MRNATSRRIGNRLGFSDDDLSTPGHDALVLWARKHWWYLVQTHVYTPWAAKLGEPKPDRGRSPFGYYAPVIEERGASGGWLDICGRGYAFDGTREKHWCLAFEVKTTIQSFGELVRQLRQYEKHVTMRPCTSYGGSYESTALGRVIVLSPDSRFRDALEDQGFGFHWVCMDAITSENGKAE